MAPIPCVWFVGLSGAGKTTIACALQERAGGYVLDGDEVRAGLCSDLGFSMNDRNENLRRMAWLARIVADAGIMPIVACMSPTRASRDFARGFFPNTFIEVYLAADLATCEIRDTKDIYARARAGELENVIGVDLPFEYPDNPEVTIKPIMATDEAVARILRAIDNRVRCGL